MLRIAVPNKGSLSETAADMLAEAGYAGRRDPKTLHVVDADNDVEFFYLRPVSYTHLTLPTNREV